MAAARGSGCAMAANLSRNGPALQEAYLRVVTEKSPTDWWAPRRVGAGPGGGAKGRNPRGHGRTGTHLRAPHLLRAPRGAVPTLSLLAPPRVTPQGRSIPRSAPPWWTLPGCPW